MFAQRLGIFVLLFLTALSSISFARVQKQAFCYYLDKQGQMVDGDNVEKKLPIASVSKIITSHWVTYNAINDPRFWTNNDPRSGLYYRFKTYIFLNKVDKNQYDVHIQGGYDPFFGRDSIYFLYSELNRLGVKSVRNFTFDERFKLFWNVVENQENSLQNISKEGIKKTLRSHLSVNQYQYSLLRKRASESDVQLLTTYKLQVKNFDFKSSADFKQDAESNKNLQTFTMQSAPLYRYLKAMNLVSNNHVADFLFNLIGGAAGYKQFIKDRLDYSTNDIEMFNGSGDNVPTRKGSLYNSASCTAVVNIVLDLRRLLMSVPKNDNAESTKKYFDLEDVMSISEADSEGEHGSIHSTIQRYNDLDTSLIAKTGTLNKYSSLAGMISTEKGDLYFSIVVSKFSQKENDSAKVVIKKNVMSIIKKFSGVSPIDTYTPLAFVPFDADSKLVEYTGTNQSITGLAKN